IVAEGHAETSVRKSVWHHRMRHPRSMDDGDRGMGVGQADDQVKGARYGMKTGKGPSPLSSGNLRRDSARLTIPARSAGTALGASASRCLPKRAMSNAILASASDGGVSTLVLALSWSSAFGSSARAGDGATRAPRARERTKSRRLRGGFMAMDPPG